MKIVKNKNKLKLDIVSTPIGNIDEISLRAIRTLKESDTIFCEDTRVTKQLLKLLNIDYKDKKFISVNGFNEKEMIDFCINKIIDNKMCVLVSDAGYPLISDPGYSIVQACYENDIFINVINGPSSFIHALIVSGSISNKFLFHGFLENKKESIRKQLTNYVNSNTLTQIFFLSPHKLIYSLKYINEILGNIKISLCKELTKRNETIYIGQIEELITSEELNLKGEFVLIIHPFELSQDHKISKEEYIKNNIKKYKTKELANLVAKEYNINSSEAYSIILDIKEGK
jgi:16S rRNA (cytidine1402-2'-O)-methyltransferase